MDRVSDDLSGCQSVVHKGSQTGWSYASRDQSQLLDVYIFRKTMQGLPETTQALHDG